MIVLHRLLPVALIAPIFIHPATSNAAEITYRELSSDSAVINIRGDITSGDFEKFRRISVRYSQAIVTLDSDGGQLLPAIDIGKVIKITGYVTLVPENAICASSCALIWVAGSTRLLSPKGNVGFHASYRDNNGKLEESGVANALIGNYLTLLNLPEKAIIFATRASPKEISWLTSHNKRVAGIDFEDFPANESQAASLPSPPAPIPRPIYTPPKQTASLPPSLPAKLSGSGENWIKFAGNAYYDANSVKQVKDISGDKAGREFWVVIQHQPKNKEKLNYSLAKYFIYCPNQSLSIYYWIDYLMDGKSKAKETSSASRPITPGSPQKFLLNQVCQ